MFKAEVRSFYDSLEKCRKDNCGNYLSGKCTVIDKIPDDLCVAALHKKFTSVDSENDYLRELLQQLLDKITTIECQVDAINVIADFIDYRD